MVNVAIQMLQIVFKATQFYNPGECTTRPAEVISQL